MLADLKQLSQQSFIYGVATAAGRMITLVTAPILTRLFAPAEFGIIALVQIAVSLAVIFAGMNLTSGMTYYYNYYEDRVIQRRIISTSFLFVIFSAIFISSVFYLFAQQISTLLNIRVNGKTQFDVALYLQITSLSLFFGLVMTASQSILRILQRPRSFLAVELISLFSNFLFLLIFVVWMRLGLVGVFWSGAVGSCIGMFAGLFSVKEKLKAKISLALLTPIVIYAVPQLPGMFINWTQSQVGRLFINYYTNLEEQGLYSIAFAIGSVLLIFTTAFRLAYDPYALSIMKRPDAKQTYAKFYAFYSFFFCTIFAITACFAKPILIILTPIEYHSAHKIVLWIAGAAFFLGANNIMGTGIWIARRTVFTSYAQIFTFLAVITASYFLVPKFQALGAAMAYFIGTMVQSISYYTFAQRLYSIPYRYWLVNVMVASSVCLAWLNGQIVSERNFWFSFGCGFIFFILISIMAFFFSFDVKTRNKTIEFVLQKWSSMRLFK